MRKLGGTEKKLRVLEKKLGEMKEKKRGFWQKVCRRIADKRKGVPLVRFSSPIWCEKATHTLRVFGRMIVIAHRM